MATVKKGVLTVSPEWWKHLRSTKRTFWKGERRAAKKFALREAVDSSNKERAETSAETLN